MRRVLVAAAAAALVVTGAIGPSAPAAADPVGSCSTSRGVLVVVDLRPFGGNVTRGCDASPTTGYAALHEAGFTTAGTQHDGPAFICRINGRPTTKQDACVRTPPASAYWSYWHANSGATSWSYSTLGASAYKPKAGSIDAWVFGGTDVGGTSGQPCFSPSDARAGRATACSVKAAPTPKRTKTKTVRTPTRDARPTSAGAATTTRPAVRTAAPSTTASSTRTSAAARPTASSTAPTSSAAPTIVDATAAAADRNDSSSSNGSGSATPLILGIGLAAVLAAGAAVTMVRRRRSDPEL